MDLENYLEENNCSHFSEHGTFDYEDPCVKTYLNFNFSVDPFLQMEEIEASYYFTGLNILTGLIFLIGLSGNSVIVYVYFRSPKIQTLTNFIILNLAIADFCFLIGLPFLITASIIGEWYFGVILCKAYFMTTGIHDVIASIFIVSITLDRYLTLCCQSVKAKEQRNCFLAKVLVAMFSWIISICILIPVILYANTIQISDEVHCNIFWPDSESGMHGETIFVMYIILLGFVFPLILSFVFVVLTVIQRKSQHPLIAISTNQQNECNFEKFNSLKFIMTLVIAHFAFRVPHLTFQIAHVLIGGVTATTSSIIFFVLAALLSYLPSALNPFIYGILSEDFNREIKNVLGRNEKSTVIFKSHECELILGPTVGESDHL